MKQGKVYLIGAGPGDIGLMTVKGLRYLQKADVVIYDYHLNPQTLTYIRHGAELIYAGKRGGHHAMTQDEINMALVMKAKEGKVICRLKGGDPFVFGRGGEEAQVLTKEGIPFEVVPGITSAVAAPAYAGIPLTHRKYSSSFSVIAGNEDITKPESTIDWSKLASGFDTLVFLMGVKNIEAITHRLIEHGKDPETPTAVVRWGTRPDQRTVVGTVQNIAALVKETSIKPPAVMIIGKVVTLRDQLKWYENKPLFGQRVLITRSYTPDYEPLEDLGAELFEFPTIEIVPPKSYRELDRAIETIGTYHWIVFTSANSFRYFLDRFIAKGFDIRDLKGIKICAIGTKTADAIKKYGIKVDLVPEEFTAEGLVEAFTQSAPVNGLKGIKFLLPRAENARELFPEKVREHGGEIDTPTAYRSIKPERSGRRLKRFLKQGRVTIATFTSGATFANFLEIMGEDAIEALSGVAIAAIGPVTKRAIEKAGFTVQIMPEQATIPAMVDSIIKTITRNA